MNRQTLNVRDLTRNMKKVTSAVEHGASFTVLRNAKPIFRIEPVQQDGQDEKPFTLADLQKVQFSGNKDLSKSVDEVVYGV